MHMLNFIAHDRDDRRRSPFAGVTLQVAVLLGVGVLNPGCATFSSRNESRVAALEPSYPEALVVAHPGAEVTKEIVPEGDGSVMTEEAVARVEAKTEHISELGGDTLLERGIEEEVEATSVEDTEIVEESTASNDIPVVMNERVQWWIDYFTGRGRQRFQRHLDRADMFFPVIAPVLRENGMPEDLHYLALIESGFVTRARSRAGATGIWQFMRATGRNYGLRVDRVVDERKDPIRATQAATEYLSDLYNLFNNWYLAFAAYNCGEYRVVRSILKANTRDFWELSELKVLPKETRHYVPKFLAATIIAKNREQYGFRTNEVERLPEIQGVEVPDSLSLADISRMSGVSEVVLKELNPHLLQGRLPTQGNPYTLWVPQSQGEKIALVKDQLMDQSRENLRTGKALEGIEWHKVQSGESLYLIARRYGTTVARLKQLNNLSSNRIHAGKLLRLQAAEKQSSPRRNVAANADRKVGQHTVKRGESLYVIARAYGMSIAQLKELNGLRGSRIFPGKKLKVLTEPRGGAASSQASGFRTYRVRSGDSLHEIARRFGSSASSLKRINDLSSSLIRVGEVLRVPSAN